MDYKKEFEEACKLLSELYPIMNDYTKERIANIVPELKKSEDEKVRKKLIHLVKKSHEQGGYALHKWESDEMLAWLEKQGEKKSIWHNEDEEPQRGSLILLIMQSGNPIVAKIIEPNHTFNHGERWAYIDDLLEKQGKKEWSKEMGSLCLEACSLLRAYSEGVPSNSPLAQKIKKAEAFLGDLYHEEFFPNTYNPRPDIISPEWSDKDETIIKTMCNEGNLKPSEIRWLNNLCYRVKQQNPAEEYNITGIGSKNAQGKLGEMIKNLKPVSEVLEQNLADKVEPKFKAGDWVVSPNGVYWHIDKIINNRYEVTSNTGESSNWNLDTNIYHKFTIQDAKDGDILCTYECNEPKIIFILEGIPKRNYALAYHCYYNIMYHHFGSDSEKGCIGVDDDKIKPATKEQRDLLFQKMKEAGYEWDAEKIELKKIEQKPIKEHNICDTCDEKASCVNPCPVKLIEEQKPAWSEEDEKTWKELIEEVKDQLDSVPSPDCMGKEDEKVLKQLTRWLDWLKSLKDRVQPQPKQEWSKEEQQIIEDAACIILDCVNTAETKKEEERLEELADKLQDLRPQNAWKPSDEQMKALNYYIKYNVDSDGVFGSQLVKLYQDLLKLREK